MITLNIGPAEGGGCGRRKGGDEEEVVYILTGVVLITGQREYELLKCVH